jgi:uncharacterized protein YjbJ (UPF0337 family)
MKSTIAWIAAAAGVGVAVYFALNLPGPQYATGSDSIEDAARNTANWGSKTRIRGAGGRFVGKLKEGVAQATGSTKLSDEGTTDRVNGSIESAVGKAAQAAGQAIHELNR